MSGLAGNDSLEGGHGSTQLDGGAGADTMAGAGGNDLYLVDAVGDLVIEDVDGGADTIEFKHQHDTSSNVEALGVLAFGHTPGSLLRGAGNTLSNVMEVFSGATIANTANVLLSGLHGADTMIGGAGNDVLIGGRGLDVLTGNGGGDVFRFLAPTDQADQITDFLQGGADRIQVSATGFGGGLAAGMNLAATGRFDTNLTGIASAAFGQFVFEIDTSRLWWDIDGTGPAVRNLIATLTGISLLDVSSMQVIA